MTTGELVCGTRGNRQEGQGQTPGECWYSKQPEERKGPTEEEEDERQSAKREEQQEEARCPHWDSCPLGFSLPRKVCYHPQTWISEYNSNYQSSEQKNTWPVSPLMFLCYSQDKISVNTLKLHHCRADLSGNATFHTSPFVRALISVLRTNPSKWQNSLPGATMSHWCRMLSICASKPRNTMFPSNREKKKVCVHKRWDCLCRKSKELTEENK